MIRFTHLSGSPSAVSNYTANERNQEKGVGYYSEKGGAPSQWLGSGTEEQGLSGRVNKDDLEKVLSGITTDGEDLSKRGNHEGDRRMGTDLTFSAPKSVSIMAVSDERIAAAHDKAVANAMRYVESDMAYARLGKGGCKTEYTGSITAAAFRHEDSRAVDGKVDPHVHTHVILSNMTRRKDGTWAGLQLDMGHENIKLKILDEIYKNELARGLKEAGYNLEQTKDGFEIEGITREQIEAFSSRSKEIADDLSSHGIDRENATEAQRTAAQNTTRKGKTQLGREEQKWAWRDQVREENIDAEGLVAEAKKRVKLEQPKPQIDRHDLAQESVKSAIRHLGERETTFTQPEMEREALKDAQGDFDLEDIRQAIKERTGGLLDGGQIDRDGTGKIEQRFTTKEHLYREAEILQRARDGQGKAEPIIKPEPLRSNNEPVFITSEKEQQHGNRRERSDESGFNHHQPLSEQHLRSLQGSDLDADQAGQNTGVLPDHAQPDRSGNSDVRRPGESGANGVVAGIIAEREAKQGFAFSDGQRAGVYLALTSPDRHLGIVGAAGAGKTTSMSLIVEQYQKAGYEVIGVAPSAAAAKELESAGCNQTQTLASALLTKDEKQGKRLYVLDEAGMVSAKDFDAFLRKADREGARTLPVGDTLQLPSVGAGSAYKQLLDTGAIDHVKIDEIQRQKDPQLKAIAQAFAVGDAAKGVELAKPYMQQVSIAKGEDKTEKLAEAASAAYLGLSKEEREQTLLLVGTNKTRNVINEKVREGLVDRGEIGTASVTVTALGKSDMTREAAKKAKNYDSGMIVEFQDKEKWGDRGSRWEVVGKGDKGNQIVLQSLDAHQEKQITVDPDKTRLAAYEKREIQLAHGDQVIFKKNDKDRGIINGSMGDVIGIDEKTGKAQIQLKTGDVVTVSKKNTENLDYSYARTVHSSQGATTENSIVVGEASRVATAQIAYVATSREKTGLTIITDDAEKLGKAWEKTAKRESAIKVSGHELTLTLQELRKARGEAEKELHSPQQKKQQEIKPPQPVPIPKKKKSKDKSKDMEMEM